MSITFNLGTCPECGTEHDAAIMPFLMMSGWIEMEDSTDKTPIVGLNPLLVDALFRTNASCETVGMIEEMLFNDSVELFLDMDDDADEDSGEEHSKPLLSIVKSDVKKDD